MDIADLIADLNDESAALDELVAGLSDADWQRATPAAGWTIAHQIAHLTWTDRVALLAITDPPAFADHLNEAAADPESFVDRGAEQTLAPPPALLATWREGRTALAQAIGTVPAGHKVPWYGVTMSPSSMATARLMETWAHGLDVADALGVTRAPTARLRHIAFLGHRTLGYAFMAHGRPAPAEPVRLELASPVPGEPAWTFAPESAENRVTGPALDFCLLVTQRRHRSDLGLRAAGPVADEWLDIAQAFAGPPGARRAPTAAEAR